MTFDSPLVSALPVVFWKNRKFINWLYKLLKELCHALGPMEKVISRCNFPSNSNCVDRSLIGEVIWTSYYSVLLEVVHELKDLFTQVVVTHVHKKLNGLLFTELTNQFFNQFFLKKVISLCTSELTLREDKR